MESQGRASRLHLLLLLAVSMDAAASTSIDVSSTVKTPAAKRLGVNLGMMTYWDAGQYSKEILVGNPGFESLLYQSTVRCQTGAATSFIDDNTSTAWPTGYWNGATFEVIWGTAKGRTGTIASSTAPSGGNGTSYQLGGSGTPIGSGDYLVLRTTFADHATDGWWPTTSNGGTITVETADLPPSAMGVQALRLSTSSSGQSAVLNGYFDSTTGQTFMLMNGTYRIAFKGKGVGGGNQVRVTCRRGAAIFFDQMVTLTSAWADYALAFTAAETPTAQGTIGLTFALYQASSVLLDEVSLRQTDSDPANTTNYRDGTVRTLETLAPGVLRYMDFQFGDSLDNQLSPLFSRKRSGYSAYATGGDFQQGLHDFLGLCEHIGAEPWYVFPITTSGQEMTNLMEYLGGPTSTPYGGRRAALGHPTTWTSVFPRIHLEFGNEAWNGNYRGGSIEYPVSYGNRGSELYGIAKASPYYDASRVDLVLGGQASYTARNLAIHNASTNHDTMAMAPYIGGNIDSFANDEELFGPLFAEPEMVNTTGYMRADFDGIQASSRPVPLSVYEVNLHTTQGSISQQALDMFAPSLGAGLAVADHMLMMMRDLGARDQMVFALPQFGYLRADGKTVRLWGIVRDIGVNDRRRPQYFGVQLANEAIGNDNDCVVTTQTGDDPTWNQPLVNTVQYPTAHYLQSYAFAGSGRKAVVVFNLHRTSPLDVTFTGVNAPAGTVTVRQLTSSAPTDTNEDAQVLAPTTATIPTFNPAQPLTLPPCSMTVFLWGSTTDYVVGEGLGPSNGNRVRVYRADGSATTVDFQAYGAGQWGTNVATGLIEGNPTAEIVTGPGPGPVYGPHVRGFLRDGTPIGKVSYFAYGTLQYGANVASGNVDADGFSEILSGPGPGAVFGPHVRGWNVDGGTAAVISKISYFAYGTLRYGVNPARGGVDGDGYDEILTGPGPGVIFGPQIRGWNYDGSALTAISKINFLAFGTPQYGANVDGGDVDADGFAEIECAPGPGPTLPAQFLGFDYDGTAIAPLAGYDVTAFASLYGGRVGTGDFTGDGRAELLTGGGRDPAASSTVKAWSYVGGALTQLSGSFTPFAPDTFGVDVGSGALGY